MSFLRRWFGSRDDDDTGDLPAMPWEGRRSILEFVRAHTVDGQPGLAEKGYVLPDEERLSEGSKVRWAAGAMDGVLTHHMAAEESDVQVAKIVQLVLGFCREPTAQNKAAVYQHIIEQHIVSLIDPVIKAILSERRIDQRRLYELARSFVTEASDREPVKFGIAILGLFRQPDDQQLFHSLGRHDEFTLFCAIALANASEDYEQPLWTLARNVTGWGRIQVVERLAETDSPAIKDWMLREGYKNSVMYEYLAYTCATSGGLLAALSADSIDRELLTSAGELIQALIAGGPAQNIDDYADAAVVVELYLNHLQTMAATLDDFVHAAAIQRFLCDSDDWEARYERGWSDERRAKLRSICESILKTQNDDTSDRQ